MANCVLPSTGNWMPSGLDIWTNVPIAWHGRASCRQSKYSLRTGLRFWLVLTTRSPHRKERGRSSLNDY